MFSPPIDYLVYGKYLSSIFSSPREEKSEVLRKPERERGRASAREFDLLPRPPLAAQRRPRRVVFVSSEFPRSLPLLDVERVEGQGVALRAQPVQVAAANSGLDKTTS